MIATQDGIIFSSEQELYNVCVQLKINNYYDEKNRVGLLSNGVIFRIAKIITTAS